MAQSLAFAFTLALAALFFKTILFPNFVLLTFAPFLAIVTLSSPLPKCLILAFISGATLDLLSNDPMGVHALNYTVISLIFFRYRRYFSAQLPLHLSLFTFFISFGSTILQLFLLFLFDRRIPFTGKWILGDLILMPAMDALYALLWFAYPLKLFEKGKILCLNIKKKLFLDTH